MSAPAFAVAQWLSREAERLQGSDEADALTTALIAVCAVYEVDPADAAQRQQLMGTTHPHPIEAVYGGCESARLAAPTHPPPPAAPAATLYPTAAAAAAAAAPPRSVRSRLPPIVLSAVGPTPPAATYTASDATAAEEMKTEGNVAMVNRRFEDAVEKYTLAISLRGDVPGYYGNRAAGYLELGQHKAALEDCRMAVTIDTNYAKGYARMGTSARPSLSEVPLPYCRSYFDGDARPRTTQAPCEYVTRAPA